MPLKSARWTWYFWLLMLLALAGCWGGDHPQATSGGHLTPFFLTQTAYVNQVRATRQAAFRATRTAQMALMLTGTPTATPHPAITRPSPTFFPAKTPTPPPKIAQVRGNLYCREGPGPYYPAVTLLKPGQQVPVVGYNPVYYAYVVVQAPESGRPCWAWSRWLHLPPDSTLTSLPRSTPPPPPPGAFALPRQTPRMVPFCPALGTPALLVQVKNLTSEPLRSMELEVLVLETGARYRTYAPEGIPGCRAFRDAIGPHGVAIVAFRTRENLLEKRVRLSLKACTETHFRGHCVAYGVVWTIPKPVFFPGFP